METYIDYTETALIILAGVATTSLAECIFLIIIFIIKKKYKNSCFMVIGIQNRIILNT